MTLEGTVTIIQKEFHKRRFFDKSKCKRLVSIACLIVKLVVQQILDI